MPDIFQIANILGFFVYVFVILVFYFTFLILLDIIYFPFSVTICSDWVLLLGLVF